MGEWDLPEPAAAPVDPYAGLEEPDYSRFENVSHSQHTHSPSLC